MTAEEFIREKIKEKFDIVHQFNGLWSYEVNGEEAMRWAHEYHEMKVKESDISLFEKIETIQGWSFDAAKQAEIFRNSTNYYSSEASSAMSFAYKLCYELLTPKTT